MGWLILCIVLSIIFVIVTICFDFDHLNIDGFSLIGGIGAACSTFAAIVLIIYMIEERASKEAAILDYNEFKTSIEGITVPSEAVAEKILNLNEEIIKARTFSSKFMTKGLYSKEIGELEPLSLPEPFFKEQVLNK